MTQIVFFGKVKSYNEGEKLLLKPTCDIAKEFASRSVKNRGVSLAHVLRLFKHDDMVEVRVRKVKK